MVAAVRVRSSIAGAEGSSRRSERLSGRVGSDQGYKNDEPAHLGALVSRNRFTTRQPCRSTVGLSWWHAPSMAEFVVTNSIGVSKKYLAKSESPHPSEGQRSHWVRRGRPNHSVLSHWMDVHRASGCPLQTQGRQNPLMCLTRSAACREQSDT